MFFVVLTIFYGSGGRGVESSSLEILMMSAFGDVLVIFGNLPHVDVFQRDDTIA